jgi:peptidyl-prolyl cis-trans isomerase A (cyclophilin A)
MNCRLICFLSLIALGFGSGCRQEKASEPSKVRLKTNKGDIVIQLNAEKAPVTVANFKKYVSAGQYNGTVFHRVIDGFMIQGGGFAHQDGKLVEKKTDKGIVNESRNGLKNVIGTLAMARTSDPNSATAQFFINVANNEALDFPSNDGYAVFGQVIGGMDVVDQIKAVKTGVGELLNLNPRSGELVPGISRDVPLEPVIIEAATLE